MLASRLLLGTGGMTSLAVLRAALEASGTAMATVAVRRVDPSGQGSLLSLLEELGVRVLPNTAGCATASEAVLTAKLAREAFGTDWVKLEVVGDDRTQLPDAVELLAAAEQLAEDGFVVLPVHDGRPGPGLPAPAGRLRGGRCRWARRSAAGSASATPTTSRSSARPSRCPSSSTPASARPRTPTLAMELGCDGVLVATAVNRAHDPVAMARAMRLAVEAGIQARRAGSHPGALPRRALEPAGGPGRPGGRGAGAEAGLTVRTLTPF